MKQIKSHVFLPQSIIERFSIVDEYKNHIVNYIDLNDDMKIKRKRTSSFNVELGYYYTYNEKILSDEIESRIGNVIRKLYNNEEDIVLQEKDVDILYKFLAYQVIRTDFFSKIAKERLEIFKNDSLKTIKNTLITVEEKIQTVYGAIRDLDIHILINKTTSKFIMPINSMYTFNGESEHHYLWIQVLTPDIAIAFMEAGNVNKLCNQNHKVAMLKILDESLVEGFNMQALKVQNKEKMEMKYVIGYYDDLIQTLDEYKKLIKNKE